MSITSKPRHPNKEAARLRARGRRCPRIADAGSPCLDPVHPPRHPLDLLAGRNCASQDVGEVLALGRDQLLLLDRGQDVLEGHGLLAAFEKVDDR